MISKELQEVITKWYIYKTYEDSYENLHRDIQSDVDAYFDTTGSYGQVLSNNDWAALCKEWALLKGYELHSARTDVNEAYLELYSKYLEERKFTTETVTEAIFKACQWILGNKENNDKTHTN